MDKKDLLAKVKVAQEVAEAAQEPYKLETFRIILVALLDEPRTTVPIKITHEKLPEAQPSTSKLADLSGITTEQLGNVFDIENNKVSLIVPLQGTEPEKQMNGSLCILAANEAVVGDDWLDATVLAEDLASAGVGSLTNLSRTLKSEPDLFRKKGSKGHVTYKLTNQAKARAFSLIRQLATGTQVSANVSQ
ncbi:MAG TPA: hypothetical protein VGS11_10500 [Candidatus Bathyarchaeia archaeon]|nr:hypothetical protein [Candidatus Bathyarchaeia archaeon]